ncbi:NhaP-type Na+/H+ or K+/H+ antiporter [Microbacteriaceae bacterium SG_E_30_P1]|uniref:NhaP-type Na+/H+ or K+/H+ antiporter n=1 Tax=Antiquaquibacter oligotrophicus TaxID=2880260 RepID=A0ABT6KQC7_9MICO|nr:sodium:proton antiporter [Antiquaquibacter oligotrophicus]MDH6181397.1 NhaP-type Na+/H+ or K+/H+ antiporter [Antiquaquibacter oligotrophicus]UDF12911.1 sodium:proton antiporter [Antiquaquibacter oligotrophicus]
MDLLDVALYFVIGIAVIVGAGIFSKKLGIATPLFLIVIGGLLSFVPGAPVRVPGELILLVLLPPILYASAISVPVVDLRRNLPSIGVLSVLLVIATAFITGVVLWALLPGISLAAAVAVGAVVSPTDAVAATAVAKRFGLPPRLVTILEGESLVNDATALVLLRSALAATAATVSFWDGVGDFLFAASAAIAIGLVVGFVTVQLRSRIRDPLVDTAISFAVPFVAFLPAEEIGASGVIAVVTAGLYSGYHASGRFTPQARATERTNWRSIQFLLENGVFLLMGLEVTQIVGTVRSDDLSVPIAIALGFLIAVVLVATRYLFIGPLILVLRWRERRAMRRHERHLAYVDALPDPSTLPPRAAKRYDMVQRSLERRGNDLKELSAEGLGWRGGVILGWAGMRGVVTLAAAQSLPDTILHRDQLVLVAFTVAVVTLLVQGGTLPWLIRLTGIQGSDAAADRRELASLLEELGDAGLQVLSDPPADGEPVDPVILEQVRRDTVTGSQIMRERVDADGDAAALAAAPHARYRALRYEVLQAERQALLMARSAGRYPSRIIARAQTMLDIEETRLAQFDENT